MNLHEECLLKYLLNPLGLSTSTELLKHNNELIAKVSNKQSILAKTANVRYITNRC